MSDLTLKQEAFCVAYAKTGNASEAYRSAYDAAAMSDSSVQREAFDLLRNPKVAPRMAALRAVVAESSNVSLVSHLADLLWLREMAAASGKYSAAVQAEMARGKVVGLYIDRVAWSGSVEVTSKKRDLSGLTDEQLRQMHTLLLQAGQTSQTLQ